MWTRLSISANLQEFHFQEQPTCHHQNIGSTISIGISYPIVAKTKQDKKSIQISQPPVIQLKLIFCTFNDMWWLCKMKLKKKQQSPPRNNQEIRYKA